MEKRDYIKIRISSNKKTTLEKNLQRKKHHPTNLIIASVENRILEDERKKILTFIEKQDNIFIKMRPTLIRLLELQTLKNLSAVKN
jgi:hypothetical protein